MKNKIKFSTTAEKRLREIAKNIIRMTNNAKLSVRIVKELRARCSQLEDFPLSGSVVREKNMKDFNYRFLVEGNYLIFYTYDEKINMVQIEAVVDGRRDYPSLFNSEE